MPSTDTTTASLRADEFWQPKTNITIIGQPADQVHGFDLSLDDAADTVRSFAEDDDTVTVSFTVAPDRALRILTTLGAVSGE